MIPKHNALAHLRGRIEVICGPMFAGKSEELLRHLNRLKYANVPYLIFKPKMDTRAEAKIKSRDGREYEAIEITNPYEVFNHLKQIQCYPFVVAFDECQFLDSSIIAVVKILSAAKINVLISGLDTDSNHQPFGPMGGLLAIADVVKKLHAICLKCGSDASRTQRLKKKSVDQEATILIGDIDSYEARCINCHEINKEEIKSEWKEEVCSFEEHLKKIQDQFYSERKNHKLKNKK